MKRAVVVGLNYIGAPAELSGCVQDMLNHIKLLIDLGFKRNEITILTDAPLGKRNMINQEYKKIDQELANILFDRKSADQFPPILKPTDANYKKALTDAILTKDAKGNYITQLAMVYAGHGGGVPDINCDENDGQDECVYLMNNREEYDWKGFTDDVISSTIVNAYTTNKNRIAQALTIYAVFDSCHSGTIMDLPTQLIIQNNLIKRTNNLITKYDNLNNLTIMCVSGCLDNGTSGEGSINGKYSEGYMSHYYQYVIRKRITSMKYPCDIYQMVNEIAMEVYKISNGKQIISLSLKINENLSQITSIENLKTLPYCLGKK